MLTNEPPSAQPASPKEPAASDISEATVKELTRAIYRLTNDPKWLLAALIEYVYSLHPVEPNRLTAAEKRFLIESGTFTPESLAETEAEVDRGSLQLDVIEGWLTHLLDTISLDETSGFLGMGEDEVIGLVEEGRLYAATVHGRLRFPHWQFDVSKPGKVLPHLPEVIEAVNSERQSRSVAAFMATPQEDLVAEGRKTPTAWLRDGGEVQDVIELLEFGPLVVSGLPSQQPSWRDVWPQYRIDLVEETARCVADNQSLGTGGEVPRWAELPHQTQQNLIENIARIFLAQDQAMDNLMERAEADRDAGSDSYAVWRDESRPNEHVANWFDAQWFTAPYDEVLDAVMRLRGWWSRRREAELYDKDFVFDAWEWGAFPDEVLVQCIGDGEFEAVWTERSTAGITTDRRERLQNRQAVVDLLDVFERLRTRVEPHY